MKKTFNIIILAFMLTMLYQNCGEINSIQQEALKLSVDDNNNNDDDNNEPIVDPCDAKYLYAIDLLDTLTSNFCYYDSSTHQLELILQRLLNTCLANGDPSVFDEQIHKLERQVSNCSESNAPPSEESKG